MADGIQGFIDTFFQVENLKTARENQAMLEQNSLVNRMSVLGGIAQMMGDPTLQSTLETLAGGPDALDMEIQNILGGVAPGVGVLSALASQRGQALMTPAQRTDTDAEAASQDLTGQSRVTNAIDEHRLLLLNHTPNGENPELDKQARTFQSLIAGAMPGEMARDIANADLSVLDQRRIARIAGDLEMGEEGIARMNEFAAQNALGWAQLGSNEALSLAELLSRLQIANAESASGSFDGPTATALLGTMNQIMEQLPDDDVSDVQKATLLRAYNASSALWTRMGLGEWPLLPTNPDEVTDGMLDGVARFLRITSDANAIVTNGTVAPRPESEIIIPNNAQELLSNTGGVDLDAFLEAFEQIRGSRGAQP